MRNIFFLLCTFLLLYFPANSQQTDFLFRNITINDGLSQSSVVSIASDSTGFMWFATQDGLNKYDGKHFQIYPEVFDDITSPVISQLGKVKAQKDYLWMITTGGKLKKLNLLTDEIISIATISKQRIKLPALNNIFFDEAKNIWLATQNKGLWKWNQQTDVIEVYNTQSASPLFSNTVKSIFGDRNNKIWILTDKGLHVFQSGISKSYLSGIPLSSITEDQEGNVWVGTLGDGIFMKPATGSAFLRLESFTGDMLPSTATIETILADNDGLIWAGTYGAGLYIIDPDKKKIIRLTEDKRNAFGLKFNDILTLHKDVNGGIWIGTDGGGLSYYNRQLNYFTLLSVDNMPENIAIDQVRSIYTSNDTELWVGTSANGLTGLNLKSGTNRSLHLQPYKQGVSNYDRIVSLYEEGNDLWVGTQGNGLLLLDKNSLAIKKWFTSDQPNKSLRIADNTIWCMSPVGNNQLLAGTRNGGLILLDKNEGVIKSYLSSGLTSLMAGNNVRCLQKLNDSVFCVGYERKGIQFFNFKTGQFFKTFSIDNSKGENGELVLKSLWVDEKYIWVGTGGNGMAAINISTKKIQFFTSNSGLPNNTVYGILPGIKQQLWISTNNGLAQLSIAEAGDSLIIKNIIHYTAADGLQSNEFNTGASFKSSKGHLYFGGIMGMNVIDPVSIQPYVNKTPVILTGISVNNMPLEKDTLVNFKQSIFLPYKNNSISFTYTAIDFMTFEKVKYEYQLENYDKDWIEAGSRTYAAYTNLPPGTYRIKVRIAGQPATEINKLQIVIAPPFWLRWWFYLLIIALIISVLYSIYRFRINHFFKMQGIRNSISADLHDDIGSRLTNVQLLSVIARKNETVSPSVSKYLANIENEVAASSEALDEIVWNMKAEKESLEVLIARMRRYAGEILESDGLGYQFTAQEAVMGKDLSIAKKRDIYLLFKEIINNIRKHAHASKVLINISVAKEMFQLIISDNGIGFDADIVTGRSGLSNMRLRVEKYAGNLSIDSDKGKGTSIVVAIPFDRVSPIKAIFRK